MSERNKTVCESCEYRGIASVAAKYCRSCQEHLCKDCVDLHRSFKLTRGHLLVDIEGQQSLQLCQGIENLRICQKHSNKPVEFYCLVHEDLMCSFCLIKSEQHRECNKKIVDIESVGKSLIECHFASRVKCELQKSISRAKDAVQTMKKMKNESRVRAENLKLNLEQIRAKVITAFDKMSKEINQHAAKMSTKIEGRYSKTIEKLEDIVKTAESNQKILEPVLESGSPEDVFGCSIRMLELINDFKTGSEMGTGEEYLKQEIVILKSDMLKNFDEPLVQVKVKETRIKSSKVDQGVLPHEIMKKQFLSFCSMEEKQLNTSLEAEAIEHKDRSTKTKKVKVKTESVNTVSNSSDAIETLKCVHTDSVHEKTDITNSDKEDIKLEHNCCFSVSPPDGKVSWFGGLACLHNERLVISDFKHSRLFLLNKHYQVVSTTNLEYEPGQISLLSDACVSVCLMKTSQILLIDVQQDKLKENKYIQTKFHPKCVQPVDDKLLVSCQNGNGEWTLSLITTLGVVCREIKLTRFFDGHRIAVQRLKRKERKLRIIQCCEVTNRLQCFEFDGTFVFDKDISKVSSVLTDDNGYIFVIRYTGEVQVLDPEGELKWKMFRQPLNKAKFAAFNKTMDKLFITLYKTPKLNVLNVQRTVKKESYL